MKCKHKFKTINTISQKTHKEGSKKFKSGFEEANSYGIKILVARQQQCLECGEKRTTVEISKRQLDSIYAGLSKILEDEQIDSVLSDTEINVRNFLIQTSKGETKTRHEKKAMYKEVWLTVYPLRRFGRGNTNEVVEWIVNISNFDTDNGRPPLNSLVVRGDTGMPGESWVVWKNDSDTPYTTVEEAQQACWSYEWS
ncbi:hypothetical protein [Methylovulum psychrotolerans]|uniref:Uncharacterized protein n=1 Tax=Methylovulum psychrotolerans TaxID=1704499 RepID=A0A2S5CR08_9GAMM|nr:hypothetical protein [Methylovulum psychrotolerans]POZ53182.1 hypothetical protein AADEFJLK_00198 [Methylovulum psychrotolerans]